MSDRILTCEAVDELLPDHLEGTLDASSDMEAHLASCARCSALVADLSAIAARARALPDLAPSRDLWGDIAARIEAPVISLAATRERGGRRFGTAWMAAAAAVLVFASSGITYLVTKGSMDEKPIEVTSIPQITGPADEGAAPPAVDVVPAQTPTPVVEDAQPQTPRSRAPRAPSSVRNVENGNAQPLSAYDMEIARLRAVIELRRSEMDPATVAIVEENLRFIDAAIAQSRTALERDPASRFLNEQLDHALAKKVDLLRTVALLPSRS
ncbi:MAG TPA: zf-HC2 domain-containing protein [Gemmatimonadaceae bacterium]|nr:zf-HC2 domain-containing protein [Gemmatimonadaceae bacterium]